MLVLTRRPNEKVVVGEYGALKIQILGVEKGQVRLGFIAPDDLPIDREEIFNLKKEERRRARLEAERGEE